MGQTRRNTASFLLTLLVAFTLNIETGADDLESARNRASSDDARTVAEALAHGMARAFVISKIEPNKLKVGGAEFRVKRNPAGNGCFVYDPRTSFSGVERKLVWWVVNENTAYAVNAPSKLITPAMKWPREDGLFSPSSPEIVDMVFEK
jgi:hypothetical protein